MPIKIISKKTKIDAENFHPQHDEWISPEEWYYRQLSDALKNEVEQADVNILMQKEKNYSIREAIGLISELINEKDITVRLIVPEARKPRTIRNSGPSKPKTHDDYNYEAEVFDDYRLENSVPSGHFSMVIGQSQAARQSRRPYTDDYDMGIPFSDYLFELIDEREMSDSEVYKRANMDRRHFSKIRNSDYHPSKKTALALAIALKLDVYQTNELLEKAGYILSRSSLTDQIVRRNIEQRNFNINDINIELFDNGLASLG